MNLENLETLLGVLGKTAADESDKKDDKGDGKDDKKEGKGNLPPQFMKGKSDDKKDEKEDKKDEKSDDKKDDKDDEGKPVEKKASATGADLAREILEKVAAAELQTTKEGKQEMNKQAAEAGTTLANALLKKLASVGDMNTTNGMMPGVVPNKTVVDTAAMVGFDDAKIKTMPGTDGMGNGGSINQIFDAVVADAMAQGAASHDQVHTQGVAQHEGAAQAQATPDQVPTGKLVAVGQESEKVAAVSALVESGIDFDQAVTMVKEAAAEIEAEEATQTKQAALSHLLQNGVAFDLAVSMVKSASAKTAKSAADVALEKRAALDMLIGEGVDFDTAADLVNAKANELYGK